MSDVHILKQDKKQHEVQVIFHFSVSTSTNRPDITYVECVKREREHNGVTGSLVPNLETDDIIEFNKVVAGEVYELSFTVDYPAGNTPGEKETEMLARWSNRNNWFQGKVNKWYKFYGGTLDSA